MQVGIDSFAAGFDESSRAVNPADRLRQLVEQIEHADEVGGMRLVSANTTAGSFSIPRQRSFSAPQRRARSASA